MTMYLKSFAPWLAYALAAAIGDWRTGAAAGVATGVVLIATRRAEHGVDLLTTVTVVFLGVIGVLAVWRPRSPLRGYMAALSLGTLALAAGLSLWLRRPFTLSIARRTTPEALWAHPVFIRTNEVITAVWAASFAVTALACAALSRTHGASWPVVATQVTGFLVPAAFTRRYPDRVRRQFAAATA